MQRQAMMQDWADRLECWERGLPQSAPPKPVARPELEMIAEYLKTLADQGLPMPQGVAG